MKYIVTAGNRVIMETLSLSQAHACYKDACAIYDYAELSEGVKVGGGWHFTSLALQWR